MGILTSATVFCNRSFPFKSLRFHLCAGLALLILGLAGCTTSPTTSPQEDPDDGIDKAAEPDAAVSTVDEPPAPPPPPRAPLPPIEKPVLKPPVPKGFLDRLRDSYRLDHSLDRKGVAREIQRVARQPNHLARRDRLLEYLPYVCRKVWDRGLPGEICLLPIVESRLDPYARSTDGAVGLWQFIPSTAKRFGLKVDWWVDERRDVVLATDAALDYLEELHGRFGDWLLALAAYNWGEGNVSRALQRVGSNAGFFDIRVPGETSRYVDRLLAYSAVFANPARFGINLPLSNQETTPVAFAVVETGGQVDLARAAEALGCELDEIRRRNPALNRWATHPEGPHRLLVSAADESDAVQALAAIPETERLAWVRHLIAPGETLSEIAGTYRTRVATLRHANRLSSDLIRAGDHLLVPTTHRPPEHYARVPPPSTVGAGEYVVKQGDTIWGIARLLGLKRHALMTANRIEPQDILRIGQRLAIPN